MTKEERDELRKVAETSQAAYIKYRKSSGKPDLKRKYGIELIEADEDFQEVFSEKIVFSLLDYIDDLEKDRRALLKGIENHSDCGAENRRLREQNELYVQQELGVASECCNQSDERDRLSAENQKLREALQEITGVAADNPAHAYEVARLALRVSE